MREAIASTCSFSEADWFFYNIISSKHCPPPLKDPRVIKKRTLKEVLELEEYISVMESLELAVHKDAEAKIKTNRGEK